MLFVCLLLVTERKVTKKPLFYVKGEGSKLHEMQSFSLCAAALPGSQLQLGGDALVLEAADDSQHLPPARPVPAVGCEPRRASRDAT